MSSQFLGYGINSLKYMIANPETRGLDPFNLIFPKMTKCTLNTYGPSGSLQNHDALCILPINILNEKIYFVAWFIMFGLGLFTVLHHLVASMIILTPALRKAYLALYLMRGHDKLRKKLFRICDMTSFGDWLVMFMLAKNTNRVTFSELVMTIKPPNYRHDLDPTDPENVLIEKCYSDSLEKID